MKRPARLGLALAAPALAVAVSLAACGGDSDQYATPTITGEAAQRGEQIAKDQGCTSCHTASGRRSTGPTWKDLAGSEVELQDGTTVTADDAYLTRAIVEPRAQVVKGYANIMPTTYADLSEADVKDLVAYLRALSSHTS